MASSPVAVVLLIFREIRSSVCHASRSQNASRNHNVGIGSGDSSLDESYASPKT